MKWLYNRYIIILTIFFHLIPTFPKTQSISVTGTVLEKHSNLPMAGVTIACKLMNDTTSQLVTLTNRKGLFLFNLKEGEYYQFVATFLGYKTSIVDSVLVQSNLKDIGSILLSSSSFDLGNVVVKSKQPLISVSHDKISLNVAESPIASGSSVYELLRRIPGIIEQNEKISFRGQSPIYLINGRPLNLSGDDLKNYLNEMMATSIMTIEVYPNPSAKYDANAGVVINIILVRNKNLGTIYNLSNTISQGRYTRTNTVLDFNKRTKMITLTGSVSGAFGKQYSEIKNTRQLTPAILSVREFDIRNRFNGTYKMGLDVDRSKSMSYGISFNYMTNRRERTVSNKSILKWPLPNFDSSSVVYTNSNTNFKTFISNAYLKLSDTSGREFNFNFDYINYNKTWTDDFENLFLDQDSKQYSPNTFLKNNSPSNISVINLSFDYSKLSKIGKLDVGVKAAITNSNNDIQWYILNNYNWQNDPSKTNHFLYYENILAGYASFNGHYKKITFQTGLRIEQSFSKGESITVNQVNKNSFLNVFPNLAISFVRNPAKPLSISYRKTLLRFGFDFVNPFVFYQSPFSYTQGNPYLKPQISHRLSSSYVLSTGIIAGAEFTISKKALGVSYKRDNQLMVTSFDNFQSTSVVYSYLNYSKKFFGAVSTNINVAAGFFNINSSTETVNASNGSNPFGTLQFSNQIQLKDNWIVETNVSGNTALASGIFKRKAFHTVDLGVTKSWGNGRWNAKLSVTDLFNTLDTRMNVDFQGVKMDSRVKFESRFLHTTIRFRFGNSNVKKRGERLSKIDDLKNRLTQ